MKGGGGERGRKRGEREEGSWGAFFSMKGRKGGERGFSLATPHCLWPYCVQYYTHHTHPMQGPGTMGGDAWKCTGQ